MIEKPKPFLSPRTARPISNIAVPPVSEAREFLFTDQDFESIRKLIYDRAGIALSPIKRDMVYSRLTRRLRTTGIRTFGEYLRFLEQGNPTEL